MCFCMFKFIGVYGACILHICFFLSCFPHFTLHLCNDFSPCYQMSRGLIVPSKEKKKDKRSKLMRKLGRSKTENAVTHSQHATGLVGLLENMRAQMEVFQIPPPPCGCSVYSIFVLLFFLLEGFCLDTEVSVKDIISCICIHSTIKLK